MLCTQMKIVFFFFSRKVVELLGSGVERGIRIFIKKINFEFSY